ncbi:MAG: hypothetical protein GXP14_07305, partial [Gammaproteobacteria bacterium]|nr:hypothetical protein [Gammaproteobacteria bacterium]
DELFREEIEGRNAFLETELTRPDFSRLFSLRQEFSQNFHRLLHSPVNTPVPIELGEQHFPLFLQGRKFDIKSVKLIIQYDKNSFMDDSGELPDNVAENVDGEGLIINVTEEGKKAKTSDFSTTGNGELLTVILGDSVFSNFNPSKKPLLFNLTIENAGNFAPPVDPATSDDSALDGNKLEDIVLFIEYSLVSS